MDLMDNDVSKASTNNHSYDDERGDYMVVLHGNSVLQGFFCHVYYKVDPNQL